MSAREEILGRVRSALADVTDPDVTETPVHWTYGATVDTGDLGLVGSQRADDLQRRVVAHGERFGHRQPHFRGGIIEQQRQCRFRRAAILERQFGIDIGPRQRIGRGGALGHSCRVDPLQEMRNNNHARLLTPLAGRFRPR